MNCDMCKVIEEIKKNENPWFVKELKTGYVIFGWNCLLYTSPSPRDIGLSRMPSSA